MIEIANRIIAVSSGKDMSRRDLVHNQEVCSLKDNGIGSLTYKSINPILLNLELEGEVCHYC